jgi:DNA repair protein RadD
VSAHTLREYQAQGLARVMGAWKAGARSVLMICPTGGGKTSVFTYLASELRHPAVILVHRRELATQACHRLREFGVDFGVIMAGAQTKSYARVQVASVQTLVRRQAPPAALVIADEAHLSTAKTWRTILDNYPRARILGVTATPWRLSGKPLADTYDASVVVSTPRELREQGYLCDYVGFSYTTPDLSKVRTKGGEYDERQSADAMGGIVDNVVEEWLKHARGMSTVVFAVTVEHSKNLHSRFRAAGVAAEHLDGQTPKLQRDAILARVARGATEVLCNVGVCVEGLDIPRLKCCVLARPTMSLARAVQMMGRVRRPWEGQVARIHDHAFVVRRHGLPDAERDYTLSGKPEAPHALTTCSECLALYTGRTCPACSHENEPEPRGEREIATVEGAEQWEFDSDVAADVTRPPIEVRWETPGRVVEGRFVRSWEEPTQFGPLMTYLLKGEKREYRFHGTTQLNALMSRAMIPDSLLRVTYLGLGGKRKLFKLEVDS